MKSLPMMKSLTAMVDTLISEEVTYEEVMAMYKQLRKFVWLARLNKLLHPVQTLNAFLDRKAQEHNSRQLAASQGDHPLDYTLY